MTIKEIASEMMKPRNLSTIIERKKEEFEAISENFDFDSHDFLEKAIRESVEEALREAINTKGKGIYHESSNTDTESFRRGCNAAFGRIDEIVKEFMK